MPLTKAQNELLCRIENGAPMGRMLRENFWFPVALAKKLVPDGPPLHVRLLGEDFIAFRSTDGRLGFFDERCPHRGASLLLARNEGNALRCIYHGWKYSVTGQVLEVPTEPRNQEVFCRNVPLKHYPVREAAGIIWAFIGSGEAAPFPDFEFTKVPADQVYAAKQTIGCNWVQDVEGGMDSAHVSILHQAWFREAQIPMAADDLAPLYEFEDTHSGYRYAAIRGLKDGGKYIRVNEFVLPWYSFICPEQIPDGDRLVIMSTPVDDVTVIHWLVRYNPTRKLGPSLQNPAEDPDNFPPAPAGGKAGRWGQDRGAMMRGHFTGFGHLNTEDFAACESQGPIADRTKEYLNAGDLGVVRLRRLLLDLAEKFVADTAEPRVFDHGSVDYPKVRAHAGVLPDANGWKKLVA